MAATSVPVTKLPTGDAVPVLGQGTWEMGIDPVLRKQEVAALELGLDLGMTLIDTAEMYGEGGAERVVGDAIAGRRDEVFLVTKFYPHHASRHAMVSACEDSLRRLKTGQIDLYLLHWRGDIPMTETLAGFRDLMVAEKIRFWGVSNFDTTDMETLFSLPGGTLVSTNQVLYNLEHRGIELDLLPWCRKQHVPVMAYSPIQQGDLAKPRGVLAEIATRHGVTPAQVALAWALREPGVIAIPKASNLDHVRENRAALDIVLGDDDLRALDAAFPQPKAAVPLEMI